MEGVSIQSYCGTHRLFSYSLLCDCLQFGKTKIFLKYFHVEQLASKSDELLKKTVAVQSGKLQRSDLSCLSSAGISHKKIIFVPVELINLRW